MHTSCKYLGKLCCVGIAINMLVLSIIRKTLAPECWMEISDVKKFLTENKYGDQSLDIAPPHSDAQFLEYFPQRFAHLFMDTNEQ